MKRILILLMCVTCLETMYAQSIIEQRKGHFRSQGNLAGGYLLSQKKMSAYVTGDADYFIDNHIALTGSVWFSVPLGKKTETGLKANHAWFGGINYHFLKKGRTDPFVGLTPGLGLVSAAYRDGDVIKRTRIAPVPLLSAAIGCNYYIGSVFHFYVRLQGVAGQLLKNVPEPVNLHELKVTAGLGWNTRTPKTLKRFM